MRFRQSSDGECALNFLPRSDAVTSASPSMIYPMILCTTSESRARTVECTDAAPVVLSGLEDSARWAHLSLGLRPPIVFCDVEHRELVANRLASAKVASDVLMCEPVARGTASALAAAALYVSERDGDGLILAIPAGRYAPEGSDFLSTLAHAAAIAVQGRIVAFGCRCGRDRCANDARTSAMSCTGHGGVFLAPARVVIEELERHGSAIPAACAAALAHRTAADGWIELGAEAYGAAPVESLDAMLRNGSDRAVAMPTDVDWCAATPPTAHREQVGPRIDEPRRERVHRPWGHFDPIDRGDRFQVKHITVNPGARLSLQMHHHRAEHWIVVGGTCRVTCGEEVRLVHENQYAFIPLGATHRIENPGKLALHLIEVQVGAYLDEDDIVRFEDNYGRA